MDAIALRDLYTLLERRENPTGSAARPVVFVDLDDLQSFSPDEAALLAHRMPDDLRVYIGVRTRPLPTPLIGPGQQVLERLTTTLSPQVGALAPGAPQGPRSAISAVVRVADPLASAARIAEQARRTPDAVHVVDTALRIAERSAPRETLILESNWYTSLLAGPEYADALRASGGSIVGPPADVVTERDRERRLISMRWLTPASGMDHGVRLAVAHALLEARREDAFEIVLRADGPDFCAQALPDDDPSQRGDRHAYLTRLHQHVGVAAWLVHRRLTAHVHGAVSSAGLEVAAFAQHVSAAPDARFSVPHVGFGLCFGAGGTVSLTRRIGRWRTAYLALSGAEIDASTALRWGLIDAIEATDPTTGPSGPAADAVRGLPDAAPPLRPGSAPGRLPRSRRAEHSVRQRS